MWLNRPQKNCLTPSNFSILFIFLRTNSANVVYFERPLIRYSLRFGKNTVKQCYFSKVTRVFHTVVSLRFNETCIQLSKCRPRLKYFAFKFTSHHQDIFKIFILERMLAQNIDTLHSYFQHLHISIVAFILMGQPTSHDQRFQKYGLIITNQSYLCTFRSFSYLRIFWLDSLCFCDAKQVLFSFFPKFVPRI